MSDRAFFVEHVKIPHAGWVRIEDERGREIHLTGFCPSFEAAYGFLTEALREKGFEVNRLEHEP